MLDNAKAIDRSLYDRNRRRLLANNGNFGKHGEVDVIYRETLAGAGFKIERANGSQYILEKNGERYQFSGGAHSFVFDLPDPITMDLRKELQKKIPGVNKDGYTQRVRLPDGSSLYDEPPLQFSRRLFISKGTDEKDFAIYFEHSDISRKDPFRTPLQEFNPRTITSPALEELLTIKGAP